MSNKKQPSGAGSEDAIGGEEESGARAANAEEILRAARALIGNEEVDDRREAGGDKGRRGGYRPAGSIEAENVRRPVKAEGSGVARVALVLAGLQLAGLAAIWVVVSQRMERLEGKLAGAGQALDVAAPEVEAADGDRLLELEKKVESLFKREKKLATGDGLPAPDSEAVRELLKRAEIKEIGDEAIAYSYRSALGKLEQLMDDPEETLKLAANSEIVRVELFHLTTSRAFPQPLPEERDGGTATEVETRDLAAYLLLDGVEPPVRARAAMLLGGRREALAVQALSEALATEPDLRVLVPVAASFRRLTECPVPSVFGRNKMRDWYFENERELRVVFPGLEVLGGSGRAGLE